MKKYILFLLVLIPNILGASPSKAFILSLTIPGGGQFYNESYIKGSGIALGEIALGYGIYWGQTRMNGARDNLDEPKYSSSRRSRNDFIWGLIAVVFLSSVDAYVDAQLKDFDTNISFKTIDNAIYVTYNFPIK